MVLLIITMLFNVLLTPGEVLWQFGILRVTEEGLILAGKMGIRLIFLILGASLMTLTTTPTKLTDALEKLMRPLKKIRVPVHEIAMMMSIAPAIYSDSAGGDRQDHEGPDGQRSRF